MQIPKLQPCDSSVVKAFSYDPTIAALYVKFPNGDVWAYQPVPFSIVESMRQSASIGSYFLKQIRNNYPASRLDDYTEI